MQNDTWIADKETDAPEAPRVAFYLGPFTTEPIEDEMPGVVSRQIVFARIKGDQKSVAEIACENADGTPRRSLLQQQKIEEAYDLWKVGYRSDNTRTPISRINARAETIQVLSSRSIVDLVGDVLSLIHI